MAGRSPHEPSSAGDHPQEPSASSQEQTPGPRHPEALYQTLTADAESHGVVTGEISADDFDTDSFDADSALGSDVASLTTTVNSALLRSVEENGRSYHRYSVAPGTRYLLPEDELEQERSDLQHQMFVYTFEGRLFLSPIDPHRTRKVLDLGTGTGIWAIDFADDHPSAEVVGTDLSPIQPDFIPPNCRFEIDDFNAEWTFAEKFDFIHARAMVGSSQDFPAIIRRSFDALAPGGWLEMSDVEMPFRADDDSMQGTMIQTWIDRQVEACRMCGVDTRAPSKYKQWMIDQGFQNVTEYQFKWPINSWPRDKWYKNLGKMTRASFLGGLEGFTLRLWTSVLGMSAEEVLVFLAGVRKEIASSSIHCYWPIYTVFGQKPDHPPWTNA